MQALKAMERMKAGDLKVLKQERWLLYLTLTQENHINLERLDSLEGMKSNYVLAYVDRTLRLLAALNLTHRQYQWVEAVLQWSEVAKGGLPHQRRAWKNRGYNLFAHNIGSAQIFLEHAVEPASPDSKIVHTLIATHGLIGQYLRGEVPLGDSRPLFILIQESLLSAADLEAVLRALNRCIIGGVDEEIWAAVEGPVQATIERIIQGEFQELTQRDRLKRLRTASMANGEEFDAEYDRVLKDSQLLEPVADLFAQGDLWYVEAALFDFTFEEFIKILLIIKGALGEKRVRHISFEKLMRTIYYDHQGRKRVNLYKKRIIEKYLSSLELSEILDRELPGSPHVAPEVLGDEEVGDTVFFSFRFSPPGERLIDFCMEAEKSDVLYESAIILLFDLFELRKDKYDRFYEEESYLKTMNQTIDHKRVILNYIQGESIIDIGPGGGALMDLIENQFPEKRVLGVDIAQNVLDALRKKKQLENRQWNVLYGDALNLGPIIQQEKADTIIFCSILHELYSYIEYQGKRFNVETLGAAFKSAFESLPSGGRIIIRDGIMTEPQEQKRIIRFLSGDGLGFLKRYAKDFQGREIQFTLVGQNEVLMPVNDAMEFLYTYTWGEKSYVHEVNEQFGYFTPSSFREFITSTLGDRAHIVEFKHYLQEGYATALIPLIEIYDQDRKPVSLPDSTCIVVIEKQ